MLVIQLIMKCYTSCITAVPKCPLPADTARLSLNNILCFQRGKYEGILLARLCYARYIWSYLSYNTPN